MTSRPIAIGTEIPPIFTESKTASSPGTKRPSSRPTAIAARIQTASQRSRKDISFVTGTAFCAAVVAVVLIGTKLLVSMDVYGTH